MLTKLDKAIIRLTSQDIPLVREPFKSLAIQLGITQELVLRKINYYHKSGWLRKYTAKLNHNKAGFAHNAMVVWNVPKRFINKAGGFMAECRQVSHCYERKKAPDWDYNLYSMIHGKTRKECLQAIKDISQKINCQDYKILLSSCEYKKSAPRYFENENF